MGMNDEYLLQKAAAIDAQKQQRQAYLATLHRSTSQQIYSHLAAMTHQRTMMMAARDANPLSLEEPTAEFKPVFDIGELMHAAQYADFAATVFMVAAGDLNAEALRKYQRKE